MSKKNNTKEIENQIETIAPEEQEYDITSHVNHNYLAHAPEELKNGGSIGFATFPESNIPCLAAVKDDFGSNTQYVIANVVEVTPSNVKYTVGTQSLNFQSSPKENILIPGITDAQLLMLLYTRACNKQTVGVYDDETYDMLTSLYEQALNSMFSN